MDRSLVQAKQSRFGADKVARVTATPNGVVFVRSWGGGTSSHARTRMRRMSGRRDDAGPVAVLTGTGLRAKCFFRRGHRAEPNADARQVHRALATNDTKGASTGE